MRSVTTAGSSTRGARGATPAGLTGSNSKLTY